MDERLPRRLAPDDPAVTAAMQVSKLRLSRGEVTMWQAWISFNLTHSLAAIMFGAGCIVVAAWFGMGWFWENAVYYSGWLMLGAVVAAALTW